MLSNIIKKTKLTRVSIRYKNELIKFNLLDELKIDENKITLELEHQPSYYGFLSTLHKKLLKIQEDNEMEKDKVYSQLFMSKKSDINRDTNRPFPDDYCKAYALSHKDYIEAYKNYTLAKENAGVLYSCVKSFEQRKDILQTISANNRKSE